MNTKFPDKMLSEYGIAAKSPLQLIEEFIVEMGIQHQIEIHEIIFSDYGLLEVINYSLAEKKLPGDELIYATHIDTSMGKVTLSASKDKV